MIFAYLALAIMAVHTIHFEGRPYRQDEAWIVHAALEKYGAQEIVQWVANDIHPPLWVIIANAWVDVFGQDEIVTRYLSTLFTLASLALVFRLANDLSSRRRTATALGAVFLVGTSAFFQFYGQEFRPYPALITGTLATIWSFLLWMRRPNFCHALMFVCAGIATLYIHFFAVYVIAALAIFFVLFVRWNFRLYLRAFGLFFAIGLSYLGWLLPFLYAILVASPGGVPYNLTSTSATLSLLWRYMVPQPDAIMKLLFITSVGLILYLALRRRGNRRPTNAASERFRFPAWWSQAYVFVVGVIIFALAFAVNIDLHTLTQRELVILVPLAALFLAFGFGVLPLVAQVVVIVLLLPSAFKFVDYESPGPQAQLAAYISLSYRPGDPVIVNVPDVPRQIALLYYVQNRMNTPVPNDLVWQVLLARPVDMRAMPYMPVHPMLDVSTATLGKLRAFLGATSRSAQVWYIERYGGNGFSPFIESVIRERYKLYKQRLWKNEYSVMQYCHPGSTSSCATGNALG